MVLGSAKLRDHPEMAAQLRTGPAELSMTVGCTQVPGAEAVYFGPGQPRIETAPVHPALAPG
jgi:hypothetical protein